MAASTLGYHRWLRELERELEQRMNIPYVIGIYGAFALLFSIVTYLLYIY